MKKIIIALTACVLTASAFARMPDPGYKVLEEFRKEFPSAGQVSWTEEEEFSRASFILGGKRIVAYFNREGQLEGSVRDLFYDQLPLTVMTAVEKRFQKPEVLYLREINNVEGTHYRIRLDAGGKKLMIRVAPDGNISDIDKVK